MKVAFRADASTRIGSGHVMRCLALADELARRGAQIHFICRELPGHLVDLVHSQGHPLSLLPPPTSSHIPPGGAPAHAAWLGLPWETDAAETGACLAEGADWLVVDHYALDARWESAVAHRVALILAIDDLADRPHACDLLLDQNLQPPDRYAGLLPETCEVLAGPRHALLRPSFRDARAKLSRREGQVRHLLVFFGGGDASDETGKVLRALAAMETPSFDVEVVVGGSNVHKDAIHALCAAQLGCRFHCQVEEMAELMARADLALGATGTATWERACLGLPALVVSLAENQHAIARDAQAAGLLTWLGPAERVDASAWRQAILGALSSPERLAMQSRAGMALVDGLGTQRVADRMRP